MKTVLLALLLLAPTSQAAKANWITHVETDDYLLQVDPASIQKGSMIVFTFRSVQKGQIDNVVGGVYSYRVSFAAEDCSRYTIQHKVTDLKYNVSYNSESKIGTPYWTMLRKICDPAPRKKKHH